MVALIGALAFLGFFFYTFASNEGITAEYYSDGAKIRDGGLDPDTLFDFGLRQVIVGADINEANSVLWGGRQSMMATLVGSDNQPFTGRGRNVILNGALVPDLDQDHSGAADGTQGYVNINDSPGAVGGYRNLHLYGNDGQPGIAGFDDNGIGGTDDAGEAGWPGSDDIQAPDVDYTYPDINNPFLAYKANGLDASGNAFRVIIPSYHRPQYLRNVVGNTDNWYGDSVGTTATRSKVLRPHKEQVAYASNGAVSSYYRFISAAHPDTTANPIDPFPFPDEMAAGNWAEGIWSGDGTIYILDVDADGDGIKEAVYVDLDYPAQKRADGTIFVPFFAFTIYDADGLINLNTSGNLSGNLAFTNPAFGNGESISQSNQGASTTEVNTQWGMNADPNTEVVGSPASVFTQHGVMWGHYPANQVEAANMEWWYLTTGKPNFVYNTASGTYDLQNITVGKWGELPRLFSVINSVTPWNPAAANPYDFPFPGLNGYDDNRNLYEGGLYTNGTSLWPTTMAFYPFEHPFDYVGSGRSTLAGTFGKTTLVNNVGRLTWRAYSNYYSNPTTGFRNVLGGALMPGATDYYQTDEPTEMVFDPSRAEATDEIFSTSENYALHGSSNDTTLTGLSSRLRDLAPLNFESSTRAEQIRSQYTTDSWDLKSFSKPWNGYYAGTDNALRLWEFNADTDGDGYYEFPPSFGGTAGIPGPTTPVANTHDPFRPVVRDILTLEAGDPIGVIRKIQRRLSLNGVAEYDTSGRAQIRPLTPHPVANLGNEPVVTTLLSISGVSTIQPPAYPTRDAPIESYFNYYYNLSSPLTSVQQAALQEYLARYDRQRLARDIYVMLYALGGGRDDVNYTESNALVVGSGRPLYSDTHLAEMAQFAVNVVDALDSDDVVTVFEYDRDLGTGWSLGDNPFSTSDDIPAAIASGVEERAVVYGVEAQQLTFGEAMAVLCKRVADSTGTSYVNHGSTEIDDQAHRDFTFIELINVSPRVVDFATENDGWQIAVKPEDTGSGVATGYERRLTLTTTSGSVSTGTSPGFTIGTAGDGQNKDMSGNYLPSYLNVDYNWTMATINPSYTRIAPDASGSGLSLDLITAPTSTYRINQAPGSSTAHGDGTQVFNDSKYGADPAGGDLLHLIPTPASTLDATLDAVIDDTQTIVMELRRRVNTHRTSPVLASGTTHEAESQDNPWVVVDRIRVPLQVFNLAHDTDAATTPNIGTKLDQVKSKERFQPLYGGIRTDDTEAYTDDTGTQTPVGGAHIYNSLGGDNRSSPPTYSLWQPYLDREFSTSYELFTVPVHSPRDTTLNLGSRQSEDFTTAGSPLLVGWYAGINRFLQPGKIIGWNAGTVYQYGEEIIPDQYAGEIYRCTTAGTSGGAPPTWGGATVGDGSVTWHKIPGARANRWARLLEFFEVPAREGRHDEISPNILDLGNLGNNDTDLPTGGIRQPGRINLNTVRHPAVEAGLLDDPDVMSINPTATGLQTLVPGTGFLPAWDPTDTLSPTLDPFYDAAYPGRTRDWWAEFIRARDGLDPISATYIPGVPGARPYRGLNFTAEGGSSIDHTIFRDISTGDGRKLFELGSIADHYNSSLDYVSRQRLLTKLGQTTTTRSNVFIVHMQVDFFEAKEIDITTGAAPVSGTNNPTVVRIGAKLPDSPGHRGFFVVDRSRGLEMPTTADLPQYRWSQFPALSRTYDFNRREDSNGNGILDVGEDLNGNGILDRFPFRSLIIHRQLIK